MNLFKKNVIDMKKNELDAVLDVELSKKIEVSVKTVKLFDVVYLSEDDDTPYEVLDVGEPFILILNTKTNFANLYKPKKLFKKII